MENLAIKQTMSSREIAELTGKDHRNVLRDCDVLNESYEKLSLLKIEQTPYVNEQNGQTYREYRLSKMQTFDLMTGYNTELRIKVNRRWEELESTIKTIDSLSRKDIALMLLESETEKEKLQLQAQSQQKEIEAQKPKVLFAESVETSNESVLVADLAKVLKQNGVEIGQNRLFQWLRNNHYLCVKGEYYNQPTQKSMDLKLFEVKKQAINKPNGTIIISATTKVTGKGQVYFVNKFLSEAA